MLSSPEYCFFSPCHKERKKKKDLPSAPHCLSVVISCFVLLKKGVSTFPRILQRVCQLYVISHKYKYAYLYDMCIISKASVSRPSLLLYLNEPIKNIFSAEGGMIRIEVGSTSIAGLTEANSA